MSVLNKVRQWIDGDTSELVLEQAARDAQVKPRSPAEEFIVKIARAVEEVMQRELVPLPQGTTIIPSEYAIFLSADDDRDWQGVKRKGLEQGLYHILAERAREIAGKRKLETKSFVLELKVDGTLEKGEVRIQHSWDEESGGKTSVLKRQSAPNEEKSRARENSSYAPPEPPRFTSAAGDGALSEIECAVPIAVGDDDDEVLTNVRKRPEPLYRLEIWFKGVRQTVVPIYKSEIVVGRGSRSRPVDVALTGDPEISRRHLRLTTDGAGRFWALNEGRNAAQIGVSELPAGERVPIRAGLRVAICSYVLKILAV